MFAVAGLGARDAVQDLRLDPRIRLVDSPSAATILLVAGVLPQELGEPLARLHDSLPHPRAVVTWTPGAPATPWLDVLEGRAAAAEGLLAEAVVAVQQDLLAGRRPSSPPILPDEDPAPWRGIGPYAQGGTGMTGGTPYGRPMAELGPDRDGLRLDILPLAVGPFFPRWPAGLALDLRLGGDVVVEVSPPTSPFAAGGFAGPARPGLAPFLRALREPVPVRELELARAREHLRWLADALVACGLRSLGARVLRLAASLTPDDRDAVAGLRRTLRWTQATRWATGGVGVLSPETVQGLGLGPVARAAGVDEDLRSADPAYRDLGFEPAVQGEGDAAARWQQRLAEAEQSLALAARAGEARTLPAGQVETPRGRLDADGSATARLLALLPGLLQGLEWGDAVTTLVSLDLDFEEGASVAQAVEPALAS